jgi:hypothetical protein
VRSGSAKGTRRWRWHRELTSFVALCRRGGRILTGRRPNLSIEITRECPLRCPGCYAYGEAHLGGNVTLRGLATTAATNSSGVSCK